MPVRRAVLVLACLFLCLASVLPCAAQENAEKQYAPYPPKQNDQLNVFIDLSEQEEQQRDTLLKQLEELFAITHKRFMVVIVGSIHDYPGTENVSLKIFGDALFERYGLYSSKKGYDDNALLLISAYEKQSYFRIGSDYMEGVDEKIQEINTSYILPLVREGRFLEAVSSNIPRIRHCLWIAYDPVPFPWDDVYIAAGALAIVLLLAALVKFFLKTSWLKSLFIVCGGFLFIIFDILAAPSNIYILKNIETPMDRLREMFTGGGGSGPETKARKKKATQHKKRRSEK